MSSQAPVTEPLLLDQKVAGQTMLSTYANCARAAYLYRKVDRRTHAMVRGIVFHGGVDRATEYAIENGEPRLSGEVARDFVEGYLADHPEYVLPERELDALRLMAWNWGEATVLDLEHLVGREVEVQFVLNGWLLRCRIDLVYRYDDHVQVKDYKTSLAMMKEEDLFRDFQARFYSLAVLEGLTDGSVQPLGAGLNEVDFGLLYPRYRDKEVGSLVGRHAAFTRMDLQDFKASLTDILVKLERSFELQQWPATDGSHCSFCPAQQLCPIPADRREVPEITSVGQAQELASELEAMNRARSRLQGALKGWVSENGTLFFGRDLALDFTATESRQVKDWPGLEEGVRRAVEFGEPFRLEDFRKVRHGTRFGKRKRTEGELGE